MRLVLGQDAAVADWVARHIPKIAPVVAEVPFGQAFGPCAAIGVLDDTGLMRGAVVYHNYSQIFRNIELSFAAVHPRWLTRSIINDLLFYPFYQLDCQRVTTITPKRNREARAFLDKFGFKREGVVRKGVGDDDAIVSGLLRSEWEQCRFNLGARTAEVRPDHAILQA